MQLSQLIQELSFLSKLNFVDLKIQSLCYDSRQCEPGSLFVALHGQHHDGHNFIKDALKRGAGALVVEKNIPLPSHVPVFLVQNSRKALAQLSAAFYGHAYRGMKLIGVTGTNGKTTITWMIQWILQALGERSGRIGTLGYFDGSDCFPLKHTTPESLQLHCLFREMKDSGAQYVVLEASSHALDMHRLEGLPFNVTIFTNLTLEHLDYHKSLELYFEAKKRLFRHGLARAQGYQRGIVNYDDVYGRKLLEESKDLPLWSYSLHADSPADFKISQYQCSLEGTQASFHYKDKTYSFKIPYIGAFNLQNTLASIAALVAFEFPIKKILATLEKIPPVPGRLEAIPNQKGLHVFVDYAHTPDALKQVLLTLRNLNAPRLHTVFGCGGDRDGLKRPLMGQEVARFSDVAWITSDNPRSEDPKKIIKEILPGIKKGGMEVGVDCQIELDREMAIQKAISQAKSGEVVLIAGKGHEDYQILGNQRVHFDDREVAKKILSKSN